MTVTENSLQEALLQDMLGPYLAELFDVPLPAPKDQPTAEPVADTDGQKLPWSLTLQPLLAAVPPQLAYTSVEAWPNVPSQTVPRYGFHDELMVGFLDRANKQVHCQKQRDLWLEKRHT